MDEKYEKRVLNFVMSSTNTQRCYSSLILNNFERASQQTNSKEQMIVKHLLSGYAFNLQITHIISLWILLPLFLIE